MARTVNGSPGMMFTLMAWILHIFYDMLISSITQSPRFINMNTQGLRKRVLKDNVLYEKFAKHLEPEHNDKFVAISKEGKLIVEGNQVEVLKKAIEEFGSGNFALRKIGSRALGKWR